MSDADFRAWAHGAAEPDLPDSSLVAELRRHVERKLAVSGPRIRSKIPTEQP